MDIKTVIGALLVIGSLFLGYMGINQISDSGASVEVFDTELSVEDSGAKEVGYLYLGLAVVLLGGGLYTLKKK